MNKLEKDILLWPPNPNPESWESDTPNEGLWFGVEDENSLVDTFADYQGIWLVEPEALNKNLMFIRVEFAPTKNKEYLAAYQIILECFECCWHNPLPPEATWPQIAFKIVEQLKSLGWREVEEPETGENNTYWRWKS
jgi:hypothetical protein